MHMVDGAGVFSKMYNPSHKENRRMKHAEIRKVLIIGSGPGVIGQVGEYDHAGVQACKTLRSLGMQIVMVNSNPASTTTDPVWADATYIEPLNVKVLEEILAVERPDAIYPCVAGRIGFELCSGLHQSGVLTRYGVKLMGVDIDIVRWCQDRIVFNENLAADGFSTPKSQVVNSAGQAVKAAERLRYPVVVRPVGSFVHLGVELVYNLKELQHVVSKLLGNGSNGQLLVEESLFGWKELEIEILKDTWGGIATVALYEHIDPVGVSGADSGCLVGRSTVAENLREQMQSIAWKIAESNNLIGSIGVRFALKPGDNHVVILDVNPRATRSSAMLEKASGFPVVSASVMAACGLSLDEIQKRCGAVPMVGLKDSVPSKRPVTVRLPRWPFDEFQGIANRLDPKSKAVGDVLGIGDGFKEALQKTIRGLESNLYGLGGLKTLEGVSLETLIKKLAHPSSETLLVMYEMLRRGVGRAGMAELTKIDSGFIDELCELVDLEEKIRGYRGKELPRDLLVEAKKCGFSDHYLAQVLGRSEKQLRLDREKLGVTAGYRRVSTDPGAESSGWFSTYNCSDTPTVSDRKKIMLLAGGPYRIGQGVEIDAFCVQAASSLRQAGYESIVVNSNPAAVSTDIDAVDKVYLDPITLEDVLGIYRHEKPEGVIVQFGGRTPLQIAAQLSEQGVRILGTPPETIEAAEDPDRYRQLVRKLGIPVPASGRIQDYQQALELAGKIGYPIILRCPGSAGRKKVEIVYDERALERCLGNVGDGWADNPVYLDQFLDNAIEAEVDAIADGKEAFVPAVMEYIELAGIHAGDSACVLPPISIAPKQIDTIQEYTCTIATELNIVGLVNIKYAIFENTVYVLEINPRASRSVPITSKVSGFPMVELATRIILGHSIKELDLPDRQILHFGVKEAVFPFNVLSEVDPVLGPTMRSTGVVLGLSKSFGRAFFKAQEATQVSLPLSGTVLFTIADRDKNAAIEPVRRFREMGFHIMATDGTHQFLKERGMDTEKVSKLELGRPNVIDAMKNGRVQLLVDTPSGSKSTSDSSDIRKTAIQQGIPYITTTAAAIAAAKGILARRQGAPKVRTLQSYLHGYDGSC